MIEHLGLETGPWHVRETQLNADPVRLALIDDLAREDACACELRARLKLRENLNRYFRSGAHS